MSCGGPNPKGCLRNSKECFGTVSTLRSPRDAMNEGRYSGGLPRVVVLLDSGSIARVVELSQELWGNLAVPLGFGGTPGFLWHPCYRSTTP